MPERAAVRAVFRGKRILILLVAAAIIALAWLWIIRPGMAHNPVKPACHAESFEGSPFTICRYDPKVHTIALRLNHPDGTPLRSFARLADALGPASRHIVFAMNAGMYDKANQPIGLYIETGVTIHLLNRNSGPGNFHMQPNGVFWIDSTGPHVATTDDYAALGNFAATYATQSGPMLLIDGKLNSQFGPDGTSRYIRNGVCVPDGKQIVFVISDEPVSFGKFARAFRDMLHCRDALYLDGYVSSLWDAGAGRIDQRFPLGPMIVVSERR